MIIDAAKGIDNLHPMISGVLVIADYVIQQRLNVEPHLTFGNSGAHSAGSLHYKNRAVDIDWPPWNERPQDIDVIAAKLRLYLGRDFDVVAENTHLHIEHDPK